MTTDFDEFRKELNKDMLDCNGYYPAKNWTFDCQRFCYYMQHDKDGEYGCGLFSDSAKNDRGKRVLSINQENIT